MRALADRSGRSCSWTLPCRYSGSGPCILLPPARFPQCQCDLCSPSPLSPASSFRRYGMGLLTSGVVFLIVAIIMTVTVRPRTPPLYPLVFTLRSVVQERLQPRLLQLQSVLLVTRTLPRGRSPPLTLEQVVVRHRRHPVRHRRALHAAREVRPRPSVSRSLLRGQLCRVLSFPAGACSSTWANKHRGDSNVFIVTLCTNAWIKLKHKRRQPLTCTATTTAVQTAPPARRVRYIFPTHPLAAFSRLRIACWYLATQTVNNRSASSHLSHEA
jgi:hypothetical protein